MSTSTDRTSADVIALSDIGEDDRERVGNKAVNLGIIMRGGMMVPNGYVLTVEYLKKYESMDQNERLKSLRRIVESNADLCVYPLAVRSSAIGEDSADKSYAGIFRTCLNITSLNAFRDAVDNVMGCSKADRLKHYTGGGYQIKMAILIQKCIDAECAGVLFTVNPVTRAANEIILEYFNGLGESVVSGSCTPNHVAIDKDSGEVLREQRSTGGYATLPAYGRSGINKIKIDHRDVHLLDDNEIEELRMTAKTIETYYGAPQDIEWAKKDGRLYILQTRPVTTLSREV